MRATAAQPSEAPVLPPGLAVTVDPDALARAWPLLCPLQPVRREGGVVICAPRCAPEAAAAALASLPFPVPRARRGPRLARPAGGHDRRLVPAQPRPPGRPRGRARAGPDRRRGLRPGRPRHHGHVPGGPRGPPARAGARRRLRLGAAGPGLGGARARPGAGGGHRPARGGPGRGEPGGRRPGGRGDGAPGAARGAPGAEIAGRIVLANVPEGAHARAPRAGRRGPPAAIVLSGIRPPAAGALGEAWGALGLRPDGAWERGGFACLRLVGA